MANVRRSTPEEQGPTLRRTADRNGGGAKPDYDERPTLERRSP